MKNRRLLILLLLILINTRVCALSSSSYMVANAAINFFDYEKAYNYFSIDNKHLEDYELNKKLIIFLNLGLLTESVKISEKILKINNLNQKAWLVYLTNEKLINSSLGFKNFYKQKLNLELPVINYIFFNDDGSIKNKKRIAYSILEVVQSSLNDFDNEYYNYEAFIFYLVISNILDEKLIEGYFLLAQIYQLLESYKKSEVLYNKIPFDHNLYLDSQKNIAFNKDQTYGQTSSKPQYTYRWIN